MGRPHVQRLDGVADGHIPVHTHHRQSEGADEHVVVVKRHHSLTESVSKRPEAQENIGALETNNIAHKIPFLNLKSTKKDKLIF